MNRWKMAEKILTNAGTDSREQFDAGVSATAYTEILRHRALAADPKVRRYLFQLVNQRWVDWQQGHPTAPLLRADFTFTTGTFLEHGVDVTAQRWLVIKFYGAHHPPVTTIKPEGFDIEASLAWCEENGWVVRRWGKTRARAWKGMLQPVRTRSRILRRARERDTFMAGGRRPLWLPEDVESVMVLDLAYDL